MGIKKKRTGPSPRADRPSDKALAQAFYSNPPGNDEAAIHWQRIEKAARQIDAGSKEQGHEVS